MSLRSRRTCSPCFWQSSGGTVATAQNLNARGVLTKANGTPLRGFDIDSKPLTISYPSVKPTVVYRECHKEIAGGSGRQQANFATVVQQAGARFHFVLVVPVDDGASRYLATKAWWGTTPVDSGQRAGRRQAGLFVFAYWKR